MNHAHIFIVDDNTDYSTSVKDLFRHTFPGAEVETSSTAQQAFDRLSDLTKPKFDCILLDLILPCARGGELLEKIMRAAPETPVVIVTGYFDPELDKLLIKLGAQDVLNKASQSRDPDCLAQAVIHAIGRHKFRTQRIEKAKDAIDEALDTSDQLKDLVEAQVNKL